MDYETDQTFGEKLTNWKNEPTLYQIKCDLEMAKPDHDNQMLRIQNWNDLMHVKGQAKPPKVKGRSNVQPKLIRRQAEWRYSALTEPFLGSNKLFSIRPSTAEDAFGARQNELVINHQWRTKVNRVKFIDDYVRANVDEGTCIVQIGWKRITVKVKEKVPVWSYYPIQTEEEIVPLQQGMALKQESPRAYNEQTPPEVKAAIDYYEETGQPTTAVQTGEESVEVEKVLENRPTYEVKNPYNVYVDPSCLGDIEKALFVVTSFETNKAELLKEPDRYKNLDKVNWETATPITNPDHASSTPDSFQFKDILRKKVVAYEYWGFYDIKGDGKLVPIVCTWIGNVFIRMELNPFPDEKIPFVMVPYLPVKRELYGEPDAELLEDNQKILGALSRGMIDLIGRSANSQQGFAKGMLDPLNKRRYDNGQDYEFNPNVSPTQGVIEHKYPEFSNSALTMLSLQNQEAEALTGVKSFSGGMSGEAFGDVAAGIKGVLDAAAKREMAILRRLADGMVQIGKKTASMNGAFLSEEETVRITNTEFVTVKREDLKGNFDFEVDIATAEVDNQKSQDLAFMLQTMGPNMDLGMSTMILSEIAYLKRMPVLADRLAKYKPEPDPIAEQMKQLGLEKAKAEIEELKSKTALNEAKAQEALSNKDQTDLDFVEQETGTKHARDLEKQQAQARGNQNLQITKALTSPKKLDEREPDLDAAIGFNEISEELGKTDPIRAPSPALPPVDLMPQRVDQPMVDPTMMQQQPAMAPNMMPA